MRTPVVLPRLFGAIGLVLLAVATFVHARERRFIRSAARATGTVVDLSRGRGSEGGSVYYPVIAFRTAAGDSVTFVSNAGSNPPSREVGERVEVLYDPAQPRTAYTSGFFTLHIGSFVFTLLGVIFTAVGGIWLWVQRRAARLAEELRATGRRITAKVLEIELRRNIRVNNRHPWRIVAEWQESSSAEPVVFRSANIWEDPTPHVGETVEVLVDRHDVKRYLVDLEFLPRQGG
jgi:hypothetical protein